MMNPLISTQEAERRIFSACGALGMEVVEIEQAMGRVLAQEILADRDQPPFRRAMMDGVAFSSAGLAAGGRLRLRGLHAAGDPPPGVLAAGEAWEIMTGALVPEDCDTVVPYEALAEGAVPAHEVVPGRFIHERGSDAAAGDVLVCRGIRLGPVEIAIAHGVGLRQVCVQRRPCVALISTGDELVSENPEPWQVRRSNGPMLEARLRQLGYGIHSHVHAPDEMEAAGRMLDAALAGADVVILSGGISRGKKDFVRPLLEARLGQPEFHGVIQRPGKPLAFWAGPPRVFALPGNPVSVLATFARYVRPALERLEGMEPVSPLVTVSGKTDSLERFSWLLTVAMGPDGILQARPPANSGDFISVAGALGVIEIPPVSEPKRVAFRFHSF